METVFWTLAVLVLLFFFGRQILGAVFVIAVAFWGIIIATALVAIGFMMVVIGAIGEIIESVKGK